ncbi:ABC transporter ATP-binding protein [Limosilactobacillus fastidiosus]|uniref:ATP-binding cassette domain-containing protein n=1 Tax=Limosilactobacillus fastidiosus TaxID=2759855 RepID=A0A7W3TYV2_9LACO|nr:ATP-binding cassette domain-containing protein [Limosilactobacillus fastidiosus]MBB1063487.1 ATP-binding cassette domain-containing protein [Limosilactobacillus fastidiosus]MBB1085821.1 ATP-binding cassette domain-containing protein [Limosilactobacillus fastidiosus]MCD7084755.1 ATP-binding cassette domain-containing protein [Limosilactobacillus fastidiosus]MCD7085842.1 ATP-binding cassette domain-containing protein [Limosilactobacillus fastidiosus]MCD7113919.1 ATP-binding cassette domain-co
MEKILIQNLTFAYKEGQPILNDVNLELPLHSSILLSGSIGCGKTTLLKLIAGLLPKYGGTYSGKIKLPHDQRIGMLFQDPAMQFTMDTPQHELEFTLENLQVPHKEISNQVKAALAFVNLQTVAHQKLTTLSGGQLQRVALAVIIAMKAEIIMLDEPFTSIDEPNRQFLLQKLAQLQAKQGITIIISDHNLRDYQDFIQFIVQFHEHQAKLLSSNASHQLLMNANQHSTNLSTTFPLQGDPSIIKLHDFSITRNQLSLIETTNLKLIQNKVTLLTGSSGSGKSTLLKSIAKLTPYSGQITYAGNNIQKIFPGKYYSQVGLIFQETNQQFLNVTVGEELSLSIKNGKNTFFKGKSSRELLAMVGLPDLTERVIYSLSGGQRKLIQNLIMLMMGQKLLLMDEPFTGLDQLSLGKLLTLIKKSCQHFPQTLLIVSHQLDFLDGFVDYHLSLTNQQLTYRGGAQNESQR